MISLMIVLVSCFLIGIAFTNPIARAHKVHSSFGLVIFLIATNSFSSLLDWNVGRSASLVICLSIVIILCRLRKFISETTFLRTIFVEFIWLAIVAISLSPIFLALSKDIASRNFDAYYATQDGIFLSSHSVLQSTDKVTELLPLIWGADSSDRYGISFFTSLILYTTSQNPWLSAKYIYLAIASISIFAFRSLISSFFPKPHRSLANLLTIIYIISPFFILQSMYFMYGQTIALVFFPLFILLLRDNKTRLNQFWLGVIVVTSFISYPAISLILGLILFVLMISNSFDKEDRKKHLGDFILIICTMFSAVVLAFGFNLTIIIDRVWTWLGGHLGLTQTLENTSDTIQIELFSQFDSILGVPLYLGLIPHPFVKNWNLIAGLAILLVVSWYLIHSIVYLYKYMLPTNFKRSFIIVLFACLFVPLVSFIKGSGYIVFKTSTWFGPYLLVMFILVTLHKVKNLTYLDSDLFKNPGGKILTYSITSLFLFAMVFNTSYQYSKMFSTWNSFNQIPNELNSAKLSLIQSIGDRKVAIFMPTAEESAWLSGMLRPSLTTQTLSLGQNEQALTEGLKTSCSLNKVQANFSQVSNVLYSDKTFDVVPPIEFSGQPNNFGEWGLHDAKDLEFAIVVNSGAFPPTLSLNHPLPIKNQKVMRWSGGSMCLGVFSSSSKIVKVKIPFYILNSEKIDYSNWSVTLNKKVIESQGESDYLNLSLDLEKGWNSLLLRNTDCPFQIEVNRVRGNADDRPLCVMFGRLVLTE